MKTIYLVIQVDATPYSDEQNCVIKGFLSKEKAETEVERLDNIEKCEAIENGYLSYYYMINEIELEE